MPLRRFLDDPRLRLENNATERVVKPGAFDLATIIGVQQLRAVAEISRRPGKIR